MAKHFKDTPEQPVVRERKRSGRTTMLTETMRCIRGTLGRFLAIAGIVALGCGFYAGLNMCGPDMRTAADAFYDETRLYDIRVISSLGLSDASIDKLSEVPGVEEVMPSRSVDVMATLGGEQYAIRVGSMPDVDLAQMYMPADVGLITGDGGAFLNRSVLKQGRWPQEPTECVLSDDRVVDGSIQLGDTVEVLYGASELDDILDVRSYTVVGLVSSSSYVCSTSLGSTTLGSGLLGQYMYVPPDSFVDGSPYTEAYVQVDGAAALFAGSEEYKRCVGEVSDKITAASDDLATQRLDEIRNEAQLTLDEKKREYDQASKDAEQQLADGQAQLDEAAAKLADGKAQLADGQNQYDQGVAELRDKRASAQAQLADAAQKLDDTEAQLNDAYNQLVSSSGDQAAHDAALAQWQTGWDQAQAGMEQATAGRDQAKAGLDKAQAGLDEAKASLKQVEAGLVAKPDDKDLLAKKATLEKTIDSLNEKIPALKEALATAQAAIDKLSPTIDQLNTTKSQLDQWQAGLTQIADGRAQVDSGRQQLEQQRVSANSQLDDAQAQLDAAATKLANSRAELADGQASYDQGVADFEQGRDEANAKLDDAKIKLDDAQKKIDELEPADIYVLDRTHNYGVASYAADSERIDNIAAVFPLFFFLVSALVSLTTMTRMVEDERIEIGTYKALGYSTAQISSKYLIYGASASLLGGVVGMLVLTQVLPFVVMNAYGIIYSVPLLMLPMGIEPLLALITLGLGCGITLLATWGAVFASLRESPAALMQPRAPKAGKRILLERIAPLWKHTSFTWKVTFRNLFRYKKRLFMTIIGIAGCTGLLLTGLGIRDSIWDIIDNQYEQIMHYDSTITLNDSSTDEDVTAVCDFLDGSGGVKGWARSQSLNMQASSTTQDPKAVQVSVPRDYDEFSSMVTFRTRLGHDPITLDDDSVILSEKLATTLGVGTGDKIRLYDQDDVGNATGDGVELTVTGVMENYIGDLVYLGHRSYAKVTVDAPVYTTILAHVSADTAGRDILASDLHDRPHVDTVIFIGETIEQYRTMLSSMNLIMVVLVVSAASLAFIVLYDLTNINIAERQREIATLKVLGFTPREVDSYIYRETIMLTIMGAATGLIVGIFMEGFCIVTAEVDRVMFGRLIHPSSFVIAFILTLLFAVVVMLAMRKRLRSIDMVESLKSVD